MAARRARSGRPAQAGRHFLGRRTAAELVRLAGFSPDDLVVEVGAGTGVLTRELASVARRVVAVELDPVLASRLRRRFASSDVVDVVEANALAVPLPRAAFRAFGNIPFAITTALLHRLLDDPKSSLLRADLVVQWEVARKRTAVPPRNLLTLSWAPWWCFELGSRLPARSFHPRPSADAALLTIVRRDPPLLPPADRRSFVRLVRRAYRRAGEPLPRALRHEVPPGETRRLLRQLGMSTKARPVDLTAGQWVALFESQAVSSAFGPMR